MMIINKMKGKAKEYTLRKINVGDTFIHCGELYICYEKNTFAELDGVEKVSRIYGVNLESGQPLEIVPDIRGEELERVDIECHITRKIKESY